MLVVGASHVWIAAEVARSRIGAADADTRPRRIEVAFVRELAPAAPPASVRRARPRRTPTPAVVPATDGAASAPMAPASEVEVSTAAPAASEPMPGLAPDLTDVAAAAAVPPAPPSDAHPVDPLPAFLDPTTVLPAPAFEWPPSTRLSYRLQGHYRGPVEGSARVEWLRSGTHYQVHLDVVIGPSLAPLITRQMSSSGTLTAAGLVPRRYDELTRIAWRDARLEVIHFDPWRIVLPGGREAPWLEGVQDAVSQFVQLTWRFTLDPTLLNPGRVLDVPLALPRRVDTWTYDVRAAETLWTPVGAIDAVRVQPRRQPRAGGDLVAEIWFAPTLQYLPVRIVIRHDEETFIDLMIERLPQQAAKRAEAGR